MATPNSTRLSVNPLEDRLTPVGEFDPTFGSGGLAVLPPQSEGAAAAVLPDGSTLVAGWAEVESVHQFAVAKFKANGTLDPAFGTNGRATVGFPPATIPGTTLVDPHARAAGIAVQTDGRIVLVGVAPGQGVGLARFTSAGQLDSSFGTNGSQVIGGGSPASANAVTVQPDGRIVVAGSLADAAGNTDFLALRLTVGGALDSSFGGDGLVTIPFDLGTVKEDVASAVAIQPDGRIVLAGGARLSDPAPVISLERDIAVARLNADGSLDLTFDGDGKWTLDLAKNDSAAAVAVRPDGRILVGGTTGSSSYLHGLGGSSFDFVVQQLQSNGTADGGFGTSGRTIVPAADFSVSGPGSESILTGMALLPTGQVIVVGRGASPTRLTPAGQIDPAFASSAPAASFSNSAVVAAPLGRVIVAGTVTDINANTRSLAAMRLLGEPIGSGTIQVGGRVDGTATVFTPSGTAFTEVGVLPHFPGFPGDVRTATADVTGDGVPDFIGGSGPGGGPQFVVTDGASGGRLAGAEVFESTFTGGVFVAAADLDGDGKAEVIATPDRGGGPVVAIYSGAKLAAGLNDDNALLVRFFGIADEAFRGGARPAVGDLDGDGTPDLVVAAGFLGGPRIAVFSGKAVVTRIGEINAAAGQPANSFRLVGDFFAFEDALRNGAFVTAADFTGDGKAELAFGGGPGGAGRVRVVDGARLLAAPPRSLDDPSAGALQLANFFAGDSSLRGGVHLAARDVSGDGRADLVAGSGENEPSRVRVYLASTLLGDATPDPDQEFDPYGVTPPLGVFVG